MSNKIYLILASIFALALCVEPEEKAVKFILEHTEDFLSVGGIVPAPMPDTAEFLDYNK